VAARALSPVLIAFGVSQLALGVLMAAAPDTFFEEIGPYGAQNDHYLRDISTFYLALGAAALVAARYPVWRVPVLAFALAEYAIHSVNHLLDVGDADPEWLGPANLIALVLTALLLGWLLWGALAEARR
jgi:hypothetical protein